jgi:hypothetical protein
MQFSTTSVMRNLLVLFAAVLFYTASLTLASAQTRGPELVIITPFTVRASVRNSELAQIAEEAFRAVLVKGESYFPIQEEDITRAAARLGVSNPYASQSLPGVARLLHVKYIVSGEVTLDGEEGHSTSVVTSVGTNVWMRDIGGDDLAYRIKIIEKVTTGRPNGTAQDQDVFEQAARAGASACAAGFTGYSIPEGIILNGTAELAVNMGSREGLVAGDKLRVLRDGTAVGTLQVSRVFPTDSEVVIIENRQGIRPTDTVRKIFPEQTLQFRPPKRKGTSERSKSVRVIITPFTGGAGIRNSQLVRQAEDTIRAELIKGGYYAPVAAKDVLQMADRLGVRQPFTRQSLASLAHELEVTEIVSGEIGFVRQETESGFVTDHVGVKVRLRDVETDDLVNGAMQVGDFVVKGTKSGLQFSDALRADVELSSSACADRITSFIIPEGDILITPSFLVNRGSRHGMAEGDSLRVFQVGVPIGKLRVKRVFPTQSEVEIVESPIGIGYSATVRKILPEAALASRFTAMEGKSPGRPQPVRGNWD